MSETGYQLTIRLTSNCNMRIFTGAFHRCLSVPEPGHGLETARPKSGAGRNGSLAGRELLQMLGKLLEIRVLLAVDFLLLQGPHEAFTKRIVFGIPRPAHAGS